MSIFPEILDVADRFNLLAQQKPAPRGEIRIHCPFCAEIVGTADRGFHLYLNPFKNTFHCFRCQVKGGVAKFIGLLQGKGEQEVIDEYKAKHEAARRKKRKKKTWEDHPAMKLSAHQWKLMGFLGKIDGKMFHTNPHYARAVLQWAWREWQLFTSEKSKEAFHVLLLGKYLDDEKAAEEFVRKTEKETGIESLWERAVKMHQLPKDLWAEWAKRADVIVRELVEAIRNEEKAADLEGTIQRELQKMKERTA
ncbi:hypothetical protein [Brevibacillus sp. NL20B1]|uniref:hypothetical protein n=1 Tax=Brevibacillus sp. NL20B1 TaxID=2829799 RepID=UPI001B996C03|nr:hypothetical protein [Brevibacillus sp. NL20B1]MBR8660674.1 hypothetical protein [Brevibacillus sp. NL20B1]